MKSRLLSDKWHSDFNGHEQDNMRIQTRVRPRPKSRTQLNIYITACATLAAFINVKAPREWLGARRAL